MNDTSVSAAAWSVVVVMLMYAVAGAAGAQGACPNGRAPFGDIGVGMYQCVGANCVLSGRGTTDTAHTFNVEPTVWHIGGPAQGRLNDGDALVAVDGRPITTRAGGARIATIRPGERALLLVRRASRETTVTVVAASACERPSIQITSAGAGSPDEINRRALGSVFSGRGVMGSDSVRGVLSPDPRGGVLPLSMLDAVARARALGVGEVTTVESVAANSLAAAAGVRRGDVILAVENGGGAPPTVRITVRRGTQTLTLTAPLPRQR